MNINNLLDVYEKTYLEKQCLVLIKKPLIIKVTSKQKLERKQVLDIPLKLLLPISNKEFSDVTYLPQITPFKIPFLSEIMTVNVKISNDKNFSNLIDNRLFKDRFYYNMSEFNDTNKFEEVFYKFEFSLNEKLSQSISLENHLSMLFEKSDLREMYIKLFFSKIASMASLSLKENLSEKVKRRFTNDRFQIINYKFNEENKGIVFNDFGIKQIEKFYQAMRFFFFHYSDEEWINLINSFDPNVIYPYIQDKEIYNLVYQIDKIEDIFEEQID